MKKICCYCENQVSSYEKPIIDNQEFWHRDCKKARENVLRYLRGEMPLKFYITEDYRVNPSTCQTLSEKYNRYSYKCPKQQLVYDFIKENQPCTWQQLREALELNSDETVLIKKLMQKKISRSSVCG